MNDITNLIILGMISYVIGFVSFLIIRHLKNKEDEEMRMYIERLSEYENILSEIMLRLNIIEMRTRKSITSQDNIHHITNHKQIIESKKRKDDNLEIKVLKMLLSGPKTAREIEASIGRTREHTARFMKRLYDEGYVTRDTTIKPYKYNITEAGKNILSQSDIEI